jgi:hypothetical protein
MMKYQFTGLPQLVSHGEGAMVLKQANDNRDKVIEAILRKSGKLISVLKSNPIVCRKLGIAISAFSPDKVEDCWRLFLFLVNNDPLHQGTNYSEALLDTSVVSWAHPAKVRHLIEFIGK